MTNATTGNNKKQATSMASLWAHLLLWGLLASAARAQCPWTRDSVELHADCICDFNPSGPMEQSHSTEQHPVNRMSVQCAPVDFARLLAALKQTASVELPAILFQHSTTNHLQQNGSQSTEELTEASGQLASQTKLDLLHVSNSTISRLKRNTFILDLATASLESPANELPTKERHLVVAVQSLHLSRSHIELIEAGAFNGLEWSLSSLSLSDNLIQFVPTEALRRLSNLRVLDLSNNRLTALRANDFAGLAKLQILRLDDNRLPKHLASSSSIGIDPLAFAGLEATLSELNLKNMQLDSFPVAVKRLTRLAFLNLAQNQISRLAGCSFASLSSLTAISLERNRIAQIDEDTFSGVEASLLSLSLLGNLISSFPVKQMAKLVQLRRLDLGFNAIDTIPMEAFQSNSELILVALDGNPLDSLPEVAFKPLEGHLRGISVGGRSLSCDCRLSWLLRWQQDYGTQISSRERQPQFCGKPAYLRSLTSFAALKPEHLTCDHELVADKTPYTTTTTRPTTTRADPVTNAPEVVDQPALVSVQELGLGTNSIGSLPDDELFISDNPLQKINRHGYLTSRLLQQTIGNKQLRANMSSLTSLDKRPARGNFGFRDSAASSQSSSRWELRKVSWPASNQSQPQEATTTMQSAILSNVSPSSLMPILPMTTFTAYKPTSGPGKGARFVDDTQQQTDVYQRAATGSDGSSIEIERTNQQRTTTRPHVKLGEQVASSLGPLTVDKYMQQKTRPSVLPTEPTTRLAATITTTVSPVQQNNTRMSVLSMYRLGGSLATRAAPQSPTPTPTTTTTSTTTTTTSTTTTTTTTPPPRPVAASSTVSSTIPQTVATQAAIPDTTTRVAASVRFVESSSPATRKQETVVGQPQTSLAPNLVISQRRPATTGQDEQTSRASGQAAASQTPAIVMASSEPTPVTTQAKDQVRIVTRTTPPGLIQSYPRHGAGRSADQPATRSNGQHPRAPLVGRLMGWSDWFDRLAVIMAGLLSLSMLMLALVVVCVCLPSLACCHSSSNKTTGSGKRANQQQHSVSTARLSSPISSASDESLGQHQQGKCRASGRASSWAQLTCCLWRPCRGLWTSRNNQVTPIHSLVMQDDSASSSSSQGHRSSNATLTTGPLNMESGNFRSINQLASGKPAVGESIGQYHQQAKRRQFSQMTLNKSRNEANYRQEQQQQLGYLTQGRPRSWSLAQGFGKLVAGRGLDSPASSCDSDKSCSPSANRNISYNLGEAHRAYLATKSVRQQIEPSMFVTTGFAPSDGRQQQPPVYGDKSAPNHNDDKTGDSVIGSELTGQSIYSNMRQMVGQPLEPLHQQQQPRPAEFLGSELLSMSAESQWPEPYVDPEDGASLGQDDRRLVEYLDVNNSEHEQQNRQAEAANNRRAKIQMTFDPGQQAQQRQKQADQSRRLRSSGVDCSFAPSNRRSASQRILPASTRNGARQSFSREQDQQVYDSYDLGLGAAETSLLKYRSIPSLASVSGTPNNRMVGAFVGAGAGNWLRWTPSQLMEDEQTTNHRRLVSWNQDNHIESFYAPTTQQR